MKERMNDLFAAIDRRDADGFVAFLTENASFRFGNAPAVIGRDNIRACVSKFFSQIKGLRHCVLEVLECPGKVICEGEVTYTRLDDKQVTLPFADIFRMQGALIADYRIYIDVSPLFA